MKIRRRSPIDGRMRQLEIPVTQEMLDKWEAGHCIQDCMPELTPDQREFIMTGTTPEQWDMLFKEDEDGD